MGIDKLKGVMQSLWTKKDAKGIVLLKEVKLSIYQNIGTDKRTIENSLKVLKEIGWLRRLNRYQFKVGDDYLTEDF